MAPNVIRQVDKTPVVSMVNNIPCIKLDHLIVKRASIFPENYTVNSLSNYDNHFLQDKYSVENLIFILSLYRNVCCDERFPKYPLQIHSRRDLDNELIWIPRSRIDKRNYQIQINRFSSIHAHRLVICRDWMRDQHIVVAYHWTIYNQRLSHGCSTWHQQ